MPRDIGTADRLLRLVAGLALVLPPLLTGVAAASPRLWRSALAAGVVMLATAGTRFCPLHTLLGDRTRRP